MIYTKQGESVEITAYHGKHAPPWNKNADLTLVSVRRKEAPQDAFYYFAVFLKADGGCQEIDAAVDAAPEVDLRATELKKAMKQAE